MVAVRGSERCNRPRPCPRCNRYQHRLSWRTHMTNRGVTSPGEDFSAAMLEAGNRVADQMAQRAIENRPHWTTHFGDIYQDGRPRFYVSDHDLAAIVVA